METNCKDCNRLIDECSCIEETIDWSEEPKKVLTEEDIWSKEDIDAVTDYINKETLKKASKRYSANELSQLGFINGAKWQQEQSYSEKEVIKLVSDWNYYQSYDDTKTRVKFKDWFEQFKKK
jgi:hypothetical protein